MPDSDHVMIKTGMTLSMNPNLAFRLLQKSFGTLIPRFCRFNHRKLLLKCSFLLIRMSKFNRREGGREMPNTKLTKKIMVLHCNKDQSTIFNIIIYATFATGVFFLRWIHLNIKARAANER